MMHPDLGVNPRRTLIGIGLFIPGLCGMLWLYTHLGRSPYWLMGLAPLVFGLGTGILLAQWHETKKLRRAAREWADAHPGEDPDELAPQPPKHRGEPKPPKRLPIPPEDDPNWSTYARSWVDNPEKPTDEPDGMGDHD